MGLTDIVDAKDYAGQDLVTKADILVSKRDVGVGKLFTGAIDATFIVATGVLESNVAHSFYRAVGDNLAVYSDVLYNTLFGWAGLAAGIGYGLADTNKQKIAPSVVTVALLAYSGSKAVSATGVPAYYLITGAALKSGFTLSVVGSAVAPVAVAFGVGWLIAAAYKVVKNRKGKGKKGKKSK